MTKFQELMAVIDIEVTKKQARHSKQKAIEVKRKKFVLWLKLCIDRLFNK